MSRVFTLSHLSFDLFRMFQRWSHFALVWLQKIRHVGLTLLFFGGTSLLSVAAPDHNLFTAVLETHVEDGLVDYAALANDPRLEEYLASLAETDPATLPTEEERLALWINAYNAYTLKLIADAYPVDSIHDLATGGMVIGWLIKRTAWDIRFADVGGETYTLNEIEHDIIRPEFEDARIHFAIVCAAVSCPLLRSEAYVPDRLDEQLNEEGRRFLADTSRNTFDLSKRRARISKIFSWFEEDFGSSDTEVIRYLAEFAPPEVAMDMRHHADQWSIRYQSYDWSLNGIE
ncbi:MAG: DUF547 domain-containing protein [Verrucomicrobiota bacterium]